MNNLDENTVDGFGDEWTRFNQTDLKEEDSSVIFDSYFSVFPWDIINKKSVGFDMGCGSGRWAKLVAPKVGKLHCVDPSKALEVAKQNLAEFSNCIFHNAGVDDFGIDEKSMDFGYSLGVLHHIPDTTTALRACVSKLKPGAPFLLYLYYSFDNKPIWFRWLWKISDILRFFISRMPHVLRYVVSQIIAVLIYWPLARISKLLEFIGVNVSNFPLSAYRNYGFYVMRTDALDRFGTQLEQRFSRKQIQKMMEIAGLTNIKFSEKTPFWCAVGYAKG